MKTKTKTAVRRFAIRQLIKLVDRAEEWLHEAQVRLREELLSPSAEKRERHEAIKTNTARATNDAGGAPELVEQTAGSAEVAPRNAARMAKNRNHESFAQWEARRSGVAVISKREARTRRRLSAAQFDRKLSVRFAHE